MPPLPPPPLPPLPHPHPLLIRTHRCSSRTGFFENDIRNMFSYSEAFFTKDKGKSKGKGKGEWNIVCEKKS